MERNYGKAIFILLLIVVAIIAVRLTLQSSQKAADQCTQYPNAANC